MVSIEAVNEPVMDAALTLIQILQVKQDTFLSVAGIRLIIHCRPTRDRVKYKMSPASRAKC